MPALNDGVRFGLPRHPRQWLRETNAPSPSGMRKVEADSHRKPEDHTTCGIKNVAEAASINPHSTLPCFEDFKASSAYRSAEDENPVTSSRSQHTMTLVSHTNKCTNISATLEQKVQTSHVAKSSKSNSPWSIVRDHPSSRSQPPCVALPSLPSNGRSNLAPCQNSDKNTKNMRKPFLENKSSSPDKKASNPHQHPQLKLPVVEDKSPNGGRFSANTLENENGYFCPHFEHNRLKENIVGDHHFMQRQEKAGAPLLMRTRKEFGLRPRERSGKDCMDSINERNSEEGKLSKDVTSGDIKELLSAVQLKHYKGSIYQDDFDHQDTKHFAHRHVALGSASSQGSSADDPYFYQSSSASSSTSGPKSTSSQKELCTHDRWFSSNEDEIHIKFVEMSGSTTRNGRKLPNTALEEYFCHRDLSRTENLTKTRHQAYSLGMASPLETLATAASAESRSSQYSTDSSLNSSSSTTTMEGKEMAKMLVPQPWGRAGKGHPLSATRGSNAPTIRRGAMGDEQRQVQPRFSPHNSTVGGKSSSQPKTEIKSNQMPETSEAVQLLDPPPSLKKKKPRIAPLMIPRHHGSGHHAGRAFQSYIVENGLEEERVDEYGGMFEAPRPAPKPKTPSY